MGNRNPKNLGKSDLSNLVRRQQREIRHLKAEIKDLKNKLEQNNAKLDELLLKLNNSKSDYEGNVENITNEKKLEDTNDTSQTVGEVNKVNNMLMVIPTNTSLAIIRPITIKKSIKNILITVYSISLLVIAFSLGNIINVSKQDSSIISQTKNLQKYAQISSRQDNYIDNNSIVNFEELKKINEDTVGWIKVNGIEINMPVVQADDNEYYLRRSFDKSYNLSGWAFADYKNKFDGTDKNIIIYGHNRRDNIMFSPLTNVVKPEWYDNDENRYVSFITEEKEYKYEVFSVYQIEVEDYYLQTEFSSNEEYKEFLNTLKSRSQKKYEAEVSENDQILTLSTCGNNSKYRVILHAKKI